MKDWIKSSNVYHIFDSKFYKNLFRLLLVTASITGLFITPCIRADTFEANAQYQVYFAPYQNCTHKITQAIDRARTSIYVQAYSFTSKPILEALLRAKQRGILVHVILDKSHLKNSKVTQHFKKADIPVWIDEAQGIAHNKTIIIDKGLVITGSFNFSHAAQHKNKENVLFIKDTALAYRYLDNWLYCKSHSKLMFGKKKVTLPEPISVQKLLFVLFAGAVLLATGVSFFG